jgi:hypothetical protein
MITVIVVVRTRKMSSVLCGKNIASREKSTEQNGGVYTQASVSILHRENVSKDSPRF